MKYIKLLYNMSMFAKETIVQECLHNAIHNANTIQDTNYNFVEKVLKYTFV